MMNRERSVTIKIQANGLLLIEFWEETEPDHYTRKGKMTCRRWDSLKLIVESWVIYSSMTFGGGTVKNLVVIFIAAFFSGCAVAPVTVAPVSPAVSPQQSYMSPTVVIVADWPAQATNYNGFFDASTNLQTWQRVFTFPCPTNGGTFACTNTITGPVYFRAGTGN